MMATFTSRIDRTMSLMGAGLAAGVVLLGACTSGADDGATPEPGSTIDGETTSTGDDLAFASPTAEDFNRVVASRDDLTNTVPVAVLSVDSVDALSLSVSFEMESHHCHGIEASVEETPAEVIVEVRTAVLPERSLADCVYGIFPYTTVLELQAPVADRTIVLAEEREPEPLPAAESALVPEAQDPSTVGDEPTDGEPDAGEPDAGEPTDGEPDAGEPTDAEDPDTSEPAAESEPAGDEPAQAGPDIDLDRFIGRHIEEGVEWAINNDVEWRVISQDGEPVAADGPIEPGTIGFVVEGDLIVSYDIA